MRSRVGAFRKSPILPNRIEKSFCSIWRRLISEPGSLPPRGLGGGAGAEVDRGYAFSRQSSGRNRQIEFDRLPTAIGVSASENTSRFENCRNRGGGTFPFEKCRRGNAVLFGILIVPCLLSARDNWAENARVGMLA